jgi:hypothetical protein
MSSIAPAIGRPSKVADRAGDEARDAGSALRHVAAIRDFGCIGDVERTLDRARRCTHDAALVDLVDQHAYTHDVGGEDELLPLVVALLARLDQELDRLEPFGAGRPLTKACRCLMADCITSRRRGSGMSSQRFNTALMCSSSDGWTMGPSRAVLRFIAGIVVLVPPEVNCDFRAVPGWDGSAPHLL